MSTAPTIYSKTGEDISLTSAGSIHVEKEATSHGIIKTTEKPQYGGTGFGTTGSNFIEKEKTSHGIIRTEEKAQHQGAGFATMGSVATDKEKTGHGIVRTEERAQHQGSGFATMGSVATDKEKTSHGIVRTEEKAQHQGAGFATMGSLATDKEVVSHGIITAGAKIKDGPIDSSSSSIEDGIKGRIEAKYDAPRAEKAKKWLETLLGETFTEETLQESLKSGERLCKALNLVYPGSVPKINSGSVVFQQRENCDKYVKACGRLGFNKSLLFDVADLFDNKNMTKVVENIYELAHFGSRKPGLPLLVEDSTSSTSS